MPFDPLVELTRVQRLGGISPDVPDARSLPSGATTLPTEDVAQEDAQYRVRETRIEGQLVAHRRRHGEHPLTDRHGRQDAIA